jgi:hypothetical protein
MEVVGKIVNVTTLRVGTALVADHTVGATALTVFDGYEFDEDGGLLELGDEMLAYLGFTTDEEESGQPDTIQLASPLTADYEAGTRALVWPASKETIAAVVIDELGEALQVTVPQQLVPTLRDGIRDDNGETVTVTDEGGTWQIVSVEKDEVLLDPGALDPEGTIPAEALTDGLAPSESPTPVVVPFIGVLVVRWLPVANHDMVTYDVHVSTVETFTPDETTLAASTNGTQVFVRSTAAGPLAYDTDYYVRVVARDPDGSAAPSEPVLGQATQVGLEDILAGSITAEHLEAVLVLASTIKAGPYIDISAAGVDADGNPVGGIVVHDPANPTGTPLVQLHPNGCKFRGELVTDLLTVLDQATIVSTLQLGSGSTTILQNGVPDPDQAPSLSYSPEAASDWPAPPDGWVQRGITWDTVDSVWLRLLWNATQKRIAVQKVSFGGATSFFNTDDGLDFVTEVSSVARIGSSLYLLVLETFADGGRWWRVSRYAITAEALRLNVQTIYASSDVDGAPALGLDEATGDLIVAAPRTNVTGRVAFLRFDSFGNYMGQGMLMDRVSYTGRLNLRAVGLRSFDFGGPRIWIAGAQVNMFATSPGWASTANAVPVVTEDTSLRFDIDASTINNGGAAWKSSGSNANRFYSTSADQTLTRWSSYKPAGDTYWTARYADTSNTGTTAGSPSKTMVVPARRMVTVSLPPAPTGVTGANVWVGYAASGAASTLYQRSETLTAARSMVLTGKSTTGSTTVPDTNTMGGDPAVFRSELYGQKYDEGFGLWGNGAQKGLAPLGGTVSGSVPGDGFADFPIVFSTPFSVPPVVTTSIGNVGNPKLVSTCWRDLTAEGFTLRIQRDVSGAATHTASWSATAAR